MICVNLFSKACLLSISAKHDAEDEADEEEEEVVEEDFTVLVSFFLLVLSKSFYASNNLP